MPEFLLDATGLQLPRFPDARALIVQRWKAAYGDNAQTSSDSPDGLTIDILALLLTLLWEAVGETYANSFFGTSEGISLDMLLDLFARPRLPEIKSTASAIWYGSPSTLIAANNVASVEDVAENRFTNGTTTATTGTAGAHDAVAIRINAVGVATDVYSVDVDSTEFTTTLTGGETVESIRDDLVTALGAAPGVVASAGTAPQDRALLVLAGPGASTATIGASPTVAADIALFDGARIAVAAEETGPKIALAGTLNTIETPQLGVDGVTSTTDAIVGTNLETDTAYRIRHLDVLNSDGCGTPEAIRARILVNVVTSEFVRVFENETAFEDIDGRPPHSFEAVVVSVDGTVPGSDDADYAAEIFGCKPAGIQAFGDTVVQVEDTQGNLHPIGLSRGTESYLHLDITVVPGEGYPTTGDPLGAIEAAVALYFQKGGAAALELGDDFYRFSVGTPVGATIPPPAIASITVLTDDTPNPLDVPSFTAADIIVADDAILRVDSSRIAAHL